MSLSKQAQHLSEARTKLRQNQASKEMVKLKAELASSQKEKQRLKEDIVMVIAVGCLSAPPPPCPKCSMQVHWFLMGAHHCSFTIDTAIPENLMIKCWYQWLNEWNSYLFYVHPSSSLPPSKYVDMHWWDTCQYMECLGSWSGGVGATN